MHALVTELYLGTWSASVRRARSLVVQEQALEIVLELAASSGWRERVVAAKLICAHSLSSEVASLVNTFSANPESNTAYAFAKMLSSMQTPDFESYLDQMCKCCPSTAYGQHMLQVIQNAATAPPKS